MKKLFVCLLVCAYSLAAQNATLSGTVTDDTGAVPQAAVTVKIAGRILVKDTGPDGKYSFDALTPGVYNIAFAKPGYEPVESLVTVNDSSQVYDARLKVGAVSTTVVVTDVAGKATASRMGILDSEIPQQVTTIPMAAIQAQGLNDMVTALRNVSGVSAQRWYGLYEYYTIRGFNNSDVQLVDGMRLEGNRYNTQLTNVQQVDVLKGPSSVLYGGSALGGAINIIRKKPEGVRSYDLLARGGRFGTGQVAGGATGPIIENKLLYRVDASFDGSNGYRGAGARRMNLSPTLTWLINSRNRVTVHQAFNRDNFDGDGGIPITLINTAGFDFNRRFSTPYDYGRLRDSQTHILFNSSLTPVWEFRNSFFYRRTTDDYLITEGVYHTAGASVVNREGLGFRHRNRPVQNQADVVGRINLLGMSHTVLAGHEYQDFYRFTEWPTADAIVPLTSISLTDFRETQGPIARTVDNLRYSTNRIQAFFWQDQISVTGNLKINIGGRYDDYRRISRVDPWNNTGGPVSRGAETRFDQGAYTYRAGAVYKLPLNQQIYFSSSSSFQPVTRVANPPLDPETGRSFEGGYRIQTRRWYTSAAVYRIARQNVVVNSGVNQFTQGGQQSSRGLDLDVNGDLGHGLRLTANYGFTDPVFDRFVDRNGARSYAGLLPRYTQKHAVNGWLAKSWGEHFTTSFGMRYLGPVFTNNLNTIRLGGFTVFNGSVGYHRGIWELSANAENLFNRQRYFTGGAYDNQVYPGSPINVFTTLRFRFN